MNNQQLQSKPPALNIRHPNIQLHSAHFDMKLQVLVHGVDVVKYVIGDTRDDPHKLGVVQLALGKEGKTSSSAPFLMGRH